MDNVPDETKQWLKEHPEHRAALVQIAENLQAKQRQS